MKKLCKQCHFYCTKATTHNGFECKSAIYKFRPDVEQSHNEIASTGASVVIEYYCHFGKWNLPLGRSFVSKERKEELDILKQKYQNQEGCENFIVYNPVSSIEYMEQKVIEKLSNEKSNKTRIVDALLPFLFGFAFGKLDVIIKFIYHLIKGN